MKGSTLMSWLRMLNRVYGNSPYACPGPCACLHESTECPVNFGLRQPDALVLHFEKMIDERDSKSGDRLRRECDLIAIHGNETRVVVLLVEVKAGTSLSKQAQRSRLSDARKQLEASVRIVREELDKCEISLPDRLIGHAVVVVKGADQGTVARNNPSNVSADFRRKTGFLLEIARCGEDIGEPIRMPRA